MGKANRERRRAKEKERKRRRQGPSGQTGDAWGFPGWQPQPQPSAEEIVAGLLSAALDARLDGDDGQFSRYAAALAETPAELRPAVDRMLLGVLNQNVTFAWRNGWQPTDVIRLVGRELGARHVRLATDAIASEMCAYAPATVDERWLDQLAALDAKVWWQRDDEYLREDGDRLGMVTCALQVISLLAGLPRLERLCPLPGTARRTARPAGRAVDERMLARVRALLAKAESTEFEAEAETFTAAAQSLMSRYSIDAALLAAETEDRSAADGPEGRRLGIDAPYEAPKAVLLDVIAKANHCRSVWSRRLGFATVLGFPADLAAVEVLFTSLLVQATTAMRLAGSHRDVLGRSRTRSFRQSFLAAYAQRIGERLSEVAGEAVQQAAAETGKDLLPVLAARDRVVEEKVEKMFPDLNMVGAGSINNREGWLSGRAAADQAVLDVRTKIAEATS
ncbi:DUF2786 domain-containing protein [Sphaerimonospora thailandensis]|uniref:DUF2786 domain-containing protein n=1 Tax=Sphaerimonospora thailandensis TaxID=795644 RepID=A0A8J3R7G7_9ACTN|nr:DUF2786 domain-containing protein [Sphaerimonospora thailandensis]GIH69775.1 hypothetical protein Mth01_20280 [Sphaerimonospora thailandensis]